MNEVNFKDGNHSSWHWQSCSDVWNQGLLLVSLMVQHITEGFDYCADLVDREILPVLESAIRNHHFYAYLMLITSVIVTTYIIRHCVIFRHNISNKTEESEECVFNYTVFDLAKTAYEPGHTEAVIHLIEKLHYDVNFCIPSNGLSLFLCSCLSGQKKLVEYMLENGADVHAVTKDGDSAVYLAAFGLLCSKNPDFTVIDLLLKHGCSINAQNNKYFTPLHRAASKGNCKLIKHLLKLGADPYLCSKSGIYPIDSAINLGHMDAAELLKINVSNPYVWDVIEPHTPPRVQLGLQSPRRRHLIESSRQKTMSRIIT